MHQICLDACAQLSFRVRYTLHLLRACDNECDQLRKPLISTGIKLMILLGSLAQDILLWYLSECDVVSEANKSSQIPVRLRKAKRNVTKFSNDAEALLGSSSFDACSTKQFGATSTSLTASRQALLRKELIAVSKTLNILPINHTSFSISVSICVCNLRTPFMVWRLTSHCISRRVLLLVLHATHVSAGVGCPAASG